MKLSLLIFLTLIQLQFSQTFELPDGTNTFVLNGLTSSNILQKGDTLFVATNKSLQFSLGDHTTWFDVDIDLKQSSIIKMLLDSQGDLWLTLGKDTTVAGSDLIKGSGIYRLNTVTLTHDYFPQPLDPRINFDPTKIRVPVTTPINNISYDIIETIDTVSTQRYIWIASFAGSLRFLNPDSVERGWRLVTPNLERLDVAQNDAIGYGQRTFSLATNGHDLWVGTANGIYFTGDQGQSFANATYNSQAIGALSGNFITDLSYFDGFLYSNSRIVSAGEENALNVADVNQTNDFENWQWQYYFENDWVRRIEVVDDLWLVGTYSGFFISDNNGVSFDSFLSFYGENSDSDIDASRINDIQVDLNDTDTWYIATSDGLVITEDNGLNYNVYKSKNTLPEIKRNDDSLVYPSPYSPKHTASLLNITFKMSVAGQVEVKIMNYGMETVHKFKEQKLQNAVASLSWNGRDSKGRLLPNGVYFVMIKTPEDIYWNKVVILN